MAELAETGHQLVVADPFPGEGLLIDLAVDHELPRRTAYQPLLHAGVHTDAQHRPINRARDVVYENVFVAGTVRADWAAAASSLGTCAEDGWTAGVSASS